MYYARIMIWLYIECKELDELTYDTLYTNMTFDI